MGAWVLDGIQTFSLEDWIVEVCTFSVHWSWVEALQHRISKAAVVSVLNVDDCLLLGEKGGELPELETSCDWDDLLHL